MMMMEFHGIDIVIDRDIIFTVRPKEEVIYIILSEI